MSLSKWNSNFLLIVFSVLFLLLTSQLVRVLLEISISLRLQSTYSFFSLELFFLTLKLQQSKTCQHSKYLQILFKNKRLAWKLKWSLDWYKWFLGCMLLCLMCLVFSLVYNSFSSLLTTFCCNWPPLGMIETNDNVTLM